MDQCRVFLSLAECRCVFASFVDFCRSFSEFCCNQTRFALILQNSYPTSLRVNRQLSRVLTIFARAKRGRVVENEYEKANRRPGPDTATLEARRKRNAEMPNGRFQNRSSTFFRRPTSFLKKIPAKKIN